MIFSDKVKVKLTAERKFKSQDFPSYGICGGFGLGLMYVPAVVTVGQYFDKKLSLATG
jgi:hypothetical protein